MQFLHFLTFALASDVHNLTEALHGSRRLDGLDWWCPHHADTSYQPIDNVPGGGGRTETSNAQECQKRCSSTQGCQYFSWWHDGGCHLSSSKSSQTTTPGATGGAACSVEERTLRGFCGSQHGGPGGTICQSGLTCVHIEWAGEWLGVCLEDDPLDKRNAWSKACSDPTALWEKLHEDHYCTGGTKDLVDQLKDNTIHACRDAVAADPECSDIFHSNLGEDMTYQNCNCVLVDENCDKATSSLKKSVYQVKSTCGGAYAYGFEHDLEYQGCYVDDSNRDLERHGVADNPRDCMKTCSQNGFRYSAMQAANQCFCGHEYSTASEYELVDDSECTDSCLDGPAICGGHWRNAVFEYAPGKRYNEAPDDAFTIVMFSDLEAHYRGHSQAHARRTVETLRDIGQKNLKFDGEYSDVSIDPKLFLHGGDVNRDGWEAGWNPGRDLIYLKGGIRDVDWEFEDIWNAFYDEGFPLLSVAGNHDWSQAIWEGEYVATDQVIRTNRQTTEFVRKTMEKSQPLGVTYEEIRPEGNLGHNFYVAEFQGIQFVLLGEDVHRPSYDESNGQITDAYFNDYESIKDTPANYWGDLQGSRPESTLGDLHEAFMNVHESDQLERTVEKVDKTKTTLVMQHIPFNGKYYLTDGRHSASDKLGTLFEGFDEDKITVLTGHQHNELRRGLTIGGTYVVDHTVGYPWHSAYDPDEGWVYDQRVRKWTIKGLTPYYKNYQNPVTGQTTADPEPTGHQLAFAILVSPSAGVLQVKTIEFEAPCWDDGHLCSGGPAGNCRTDCCLNWDNHSYWYSKAWTACGFEPKWSDGSICALGTTCNACENPATYWWSKAFTACGSEPKLPHGHYCLLGTTCNACEEEATWWWHKSHAACGTPDKSKGECAHHDSVCGNGTTCHGCCSHADCPWWTAGLVCWCKSH